MDAPDREHVLGVAAAHVDDVLVEQEPLDVVDGPVEEGEMVRLGSPGEGRVELGDVGEAVAARGRDEADPRAATPTGGAGEVQDLVVEERVVGLHREPAATHGDDDPIRLEGHGETTRKPMWWSW